MTSHHVVVKFDTWTAYRAGAMTYRNSANQWILTTGLPLESIVMVRDHVGHCFDLDTLRTLEWKFMRITPEEPETTIAEMVPGHCVMPSCERWHCILTTKEKETSIGMHLFDWGDEQLSTRRSEIVPPEKALALAEWAGTKIKQVATQPPHHTAGEKSDEAQEPRVWKYSHIGLLYVDEPGKGGDDRSRTPLRKGKGKGDPKGKDHPKGKGFGKKGRKSGKIMRSRFTKIEIKGVKKVRNIKEEGISTQKKIWVGWT